MAARGTPFVGLLYAGLALTTKELALSNSTLALVIPKPKFSSHG
jgi:hypothetical protein